MQYRLDVAIAGGGPAGCAVALSLRNRAPHLSIALIEQTNYETARPGEVLPGAVRALFENLGITEAFEREQWRPAHAVACAWGTPVLAENHSIYSWQGHGWHLDRAKFDGFLANQAEARGVIMFSGKRVDGVDRNDGGWLVRVSGGTAIHARFIVDATGRAASIARHIGSPPVSLDPLIGFSRFFPACEGSDPRTLIEAAADGWWYTAPLTGTHRVATFMTDPDIARQYRLDRESGWRQFLDRTSFIRTAVPGGQSVGAMVRPAGSAYLREPAGDGWIAAGDAACAHDPLSGQGIMQSLRSGILASYAIADWFPDASAAGLERYRHLTKRGWSGYLAARHRYYLEEKGWPEQSFWQRRHHPG